MMFGIFKHNSDTKEVYQDLKNSIIVFLAIFIMK